MQDTKMYFIPIINKDSKCAAVCTDPWLLSSGSDCTSTVCWGCFWRGKVVANQCIGQHVTEYFWPVGWGCALIKGENSVWKSQLAQGESTFWGQNSSDGAAVGLILRCIRGFVDAPDQEFSNSFIWIRPTLDCSLSFAPRDPFGKTVVSSYWNVEAIDLGEGTLDLHLPTLHVLLA